MRPATCLLIALLALTGMLVLGRCDGTILNEHVLLSAGDASRNYRVTLTSGETISIELNVTGEGLVELHIFNSSDAPLLDEYDIGTTGLHEPWVVPYNGQFEFVIELTSYSIAYDYQPTVDLVLISSGTGGQPSQTSQANNSTLIDENITVTSVNFGGIFYGNLTAGDKVSLAISTNGSSVSLAIFNSTLGLLYDRENFTSLNDQWTAPSNDTFTFWVFNYQGTAQVHFTVQKAGGFDVLPVVIVVIVILIVLMGAFLLVRRRQPSIPPPPPSAPPPPP